MLFKLYADGLGVIYPEKTKTGKFKGLYSAVKKKAAHSSAIRRRIFCLTAVMRHRCACFFTVTSAGRPGKIAGKEIDRIFSLLRNSHGLSSYYWVKELTKAGTEHLHVVAVFKPGYRMNYWIGREGKAPELSRQWSSILNMPPASNSIRFGWFGKDGKRKFYLSTGFTGGYCAKYLAKDRAGTGRKFGRSEDLAECLKTFTAPIEYRQKNQRQMNVFTVKGWQKAAFYDKIKTVEGMPDWFLSYFRNKRIEGEGFFIDLAIFKGRRLADTVDNLIKFIQSNRIQDYKLN